MLSYIITFAVGVAIGMVVLIVIAVNANSGRNICESTAEKPFDIELMTGNKQKGKGDYFGLQKYEDSVAEEESVKKLKQMTKDNLIISAKQCFKIYHSYLGLRHRHDCLKGAMDILKSENTDYLKQVKAIEEAYMEADKVNFLEWEKATRSFDRLISCLPQTAWLQ